MQTTIEGWLALLFRVSINSSEYYNCPHITCYIRSCYNSSFQHLNVLKHHHDGLNETQRTFRLDPPIDFCTPAHRKTLINQDCLLLLHTHELRYAFNLSGS